jgi:outer membrane protein TolC
MSMRSGAALLAIVLAGCAATPPQPIDPRGTAAQFAATRISDPRVAVAFHEAGLPVPVAEERWDLDRLTVLAWALRPELAEMRSLRQAAAADLDAARERPNPTLSLTSEFVRNAATGTSPWTIALAFSWLLENPGRRAARIDQSVAHRQAAIWSEARTVWQVRSEVRRAWLALTLAQMAVEQAGTETELRRDFLELTQTRVNAGAWPAPELERARVALLQTDLLVQQLANEIRAARVKLAAAVGLTPAAFEEIQLAAPGLSDPVATLTFDWDAYHEAAVINRLDLAESLAAYDVADAAWREQMTRRWPDLTLGPGYTYDRGDRKLVLGIAGELPVVTRYDAAIAAAAAQREAARQHFLAAQAQALASLEDARIGIAGALRESEIVVAASSTQRRLMESTRQRWQAGLADRSAWLTAALELAALERARLAAENRTVASLGILEETIQQPVWPASRLLEDRRVPGPGESQ